MFRKLSHVGIAVNDLRAASEVYKNIFGVDQVRTEDVPDQRVRVAFFHVANTSFELTEATSPDSPIAKFLEKRGEGVHHLSFEVDDIRAELARLKALGFRLIDEDPRKGAGGHLIAFVHPKSTNGILIELCQKML